MRSVRWALWATAVTVILAAGSASAFVITGTPADLNYWGITNASDGLNLTDSVNNPKTGSVNVGSYVVSYWEEQGNNGGYVQPGYGGAQFDIKGLYFTSDASSSYFAAIVGMGPTGSVAPNPNYYMGDVFIGVNSDPGYKYGIVTTNNSGNTAGTAGSVGTWNHVTVSSFQTVSDPYSVNSFATGSTSPLGAGNFQYFQLGQDLWLIEAIVPNTFFGADIITGIHLTESCGNDVANLTPVPEPGTMILLGSGLVGLAGYGRKRYRK